jgi:hypothetical protein
MRLLRGYAECIEELCFERAPHEVRQQVDNFPCHLSHQPCPFQLSQAKTRVTPPKLLLHVYVPAQRGHNT